MPDDADKIDLKTLREYRRAMIEIAKDRYNRLIAVTQTNSPIRFYKRVSVDDFGVVSFGEWGGYLLQIHPMSYCDRLVMAPLVNPLMYGFGWDYTKGAWAIHAALAWDPQRQAEPHGYLRRIGTRRVAGQRLARKR